MAGIEQTAAYLSKIADRQETSMIGNRQISYFVLPPSMEPDLEEFVFKTSETDLRTGQIKAVFGLSARIPPEFRPYYIYHEVIEGPSESTDQQKSCWEAERDTLGVIAKTFKDKYIIRRIRYFESLLIYNRNNYKEEDKQQVLDSIQTTIDFLKFPERRWPYILMTQELELLQLERLLNPSLDPEKTSWQETEDRMEKEGYYQVQKWRKVKVTHDITPEYKNELRRKIIARIYEGLVGTPAENIAREIIAKHSSPEIQNR